MVGWTVETGESPEAHRPANLDNERMSQTRWKVKTIPKIVFSHPHAHVLTYICKNMHAQTHTHFTHTWLKERKSEGEGGRREWERKERDRDGERRERQRQRIKERSRLSTPEEQELCLPSICPSTQCHPWVIWVKTSYVVLLTGHRIGKLMVWDFCLDKTQSNFTFYPSSKEASAYFSPIISPELLSQG